MIYLMYSIEADKWILLSAQAYWKIKFNWTILSDGDKLVAMKGTL